MKREVRTKRQHTLGIWALALGYFAFYTPYSGLSKAVTAGLLDGGRPIPGPELLPAAAFSTAITVLLFIAVMRWWKHGRKRQVFGRSVIFPRRQTFISGVGYATIILTTTVAYSFSGISIVFALVLMRAGVLIMSPLIDRVFHRRVRWFSWIGLALSLAALAISFTSIHQYQLALAALLNLAAYLAGYGLRIPCMTQIAKNGEKETACTYFVEEQVVAMTLLIAVPAAVALLGGGEIASQLRTGYAQFFSNSVGLPGLVIGFFYAGLGICLSFLYLDRRENTFCMPLFACSSLLAGIVASYILMWWLHAPSPTGVQIGAAFLLMAALLVMSPLHHLPIYMTQVSDAVREKRLVLVEFVDNNSKLPTAAETSRFITIDLRAMRNVFHK